MDPDCSYSFGTGLQSHESTYLVYTENKCKLILSVTARICLFYGYVCLRFDLNENSVIRAVRLTQNGICSLCPADTLQNGATLTQRRIIVE